MRGLGFRVLVVWQCETTNPVTLRRRLERFLKTTT
jgi:G:T-mismatch repair DNA endonuclease (very short patch repair protein)